jgi:LPS export ABC transporter protein LptC
MVIRSIPWKALPLWIAIVTGLAALGSTLISEIRVRGVSSVLAPVATDGDLVLTGFRLVTTTNGVTEWDITASRARLFEKRHEALLDDVKGAARTRDGSRVEFEGTSGAFDTATQDATIEGPPGGTVVRLPNGHVLRAETLRWNRRAGELTSDQAVSIAGPRIEVTGTGLVVRPATQEFTVLSGVRANVF